MSARSLAIAALLPVVLLAGCSSPPSDEDLRAAAREEIKKMPFVGESALARISEMKVLGCKKGELKSYQCDIVIPGGGVKNVRMVKTDAGWAIVD
jgi:hypothetical protein